MTTMKMMGMFDLLMALFRSRAVVHHPPMCFRCFGTGIDPAFEDVVCWDCDGTGDEDHDPLRPSLSADVLRRIALGEFRRSDP
jgi:hypothetical protein